MIGEFHRIAARLDGYYDIVASALSADAERSRRSARAIGLPDDRAYPSWRALIESEARRGADRPDVVAVTRRKDRLVGDSAGRVTRVEIGHVVPVDDYGSLLLRLLERCAALDVGYERCRGRRTHMHRTNVWIFARLASIKRTNPEDTNSRDDVTFASLSSRAQLRLIGRRTRVPGRSQSRKSE